MRNKILQFQAAALGGNSVYQNQRQGSLFEVFLLLQDWKFLEEI
jgi:hypothetical protein